MSLGSLEVREEGARVETVGVWCYQIRTQVKQREHDIYVEKEVEKEEVMNRQGSRKLTHNGVIEFQWLKR
jgi:hypothetical protein